MTAKPATLVARVPLRFTSNGEDKPLHADLSTVSAAGNCLWLSSDETAGVERLVSVGQGRDLAFGDHRTFRLHDYLDMPARAEVEADLEGVTVEGGYLWVVGSHSLARKKPDPAENSPEEALARLTEIKHEANRFLLARIPLASDGDPSVEEPRREVEANGETRRAAALKMSRGRNALARAVRKDEHFGRFLNVPAKENGFDIEGIAVKGERVWLGLRGPVLRGWAIVLEVEVEESRPGRLKLKRLDEEGTRYRKHFLDLDGLGIRAMMVDGDDLLLLAGPTMDLDGPVRLYRWTSAVDDREPSAVVPSERVMRILDLPFGEGSDHAEGITLLRPPSGPPLLLAVYDSPAATRVLDGGDGVEGDLFEFPEPAPPKAARRQRATRSDAGVSPSAKRAS